MPAELIEEMRAEILNHAPIQYRIIMPMFDRNNPPIIDSRKNRSNAHTMPIVANESIESIEDIDGSRVNEGTKVIRRSRVPREIKHNEENRETPRTSSFRDSATSENAIPNFPISKKSKLIVPETIKQSTTQNIKQSTQSTTQNIKQSAQISAEELMLPPKIVLETKDEIIKASEMMMQFEREKVAPKFEEWRKHYTYKIAEGGRGAGAKTWSTASLLVQKYNFSKEPLRCLCVREFMISLAESSYSILEQTIRRLGYNNWVCTTQFIKNTKNDSYFIFRGLRDLRAAEQLKSYEGFDDLFADEAAPISMDSWSVIIPTLRKKNKEIWVLYNRDQDQDPCHKYFVVNRRSNTSYLHLEPGVVDNPWWNETTLPDDMKADYERDPDEAEHIWMGLPRKQGFKSVMSRVLVRQAMMRDIEDPVGQEEIGVDVARFGDDRTVMFKRKGMKVVSQLVLSRSDIIDEVDSTNLLANRIWEFAGFNPDIPIKIDLGYNPGVADNLSGKGANVIGVNFGGSAHDQDKYPSAASEMWFEFPVGEADIPDDQELMDELSTRQYDYDNKGRKQVEPKKKFKERYKRSPDKADALLLCFYDVNKFNVYAPSGYCLSDLGL